MALITDPSPIKTQLKRFKRGYFPILLFTNLVVIVSIYWFVGPLVAVRGLYSTAGVILSWVVYRHLSHKSVVTANNSIRKYTAKISLSVSFLSVFSFIHLDFLPHVSVTLFAIVAGCIIYQIRQGQTTILLVIQLLALFIILPLAKQLGTWFYFGGGDLILHAAAVEAVLRTGGISGIAEYYGIYSVRPIYHLILGQTTYITGYGPKTSLEILGIIMYVFVLLFLFLFTREVFHHERLPLYIVLAGVGTSQLHYFSSYFFPQAFATVYIILFLYLSMKRTGWKATVLLTVVSTAIAFTHQLTPFMFILFFMFVILTHIFLTYLLGFKRGTNSGGIPIKPIMILTSIVVAQWMFVAHGWTFKSIILSIFKFISGSGLVGPSSAPNVAPGPSVFAIGVDLPDPTVQQGIKSLFTAPSIYNVVLLSFFLVGVIHIIKNMKMYSQGIGLLTGGVFSSIFVLETPLWILANRRVTFALAILFIFPFGIGIYHIASNQSSSRIGNVLVPALLFILLVSSGFTGMSDVMYSYDDRKLQHDFTKLEIEQVRAVAEFSLYSESKLTSDWITTNLLRRFDGRVGPYVTVKQSGPVVSDKPVVYRERWKRHEVGSAGNRFHFSPKALSIYISNQNKIYDNGGTGIVVD